MVTSRGHLDPDGLRSVVGDAMDCSALLSLRSAMTLLGWIFCTLIDVLKTEYTAMSHTVARQCANHFEELSAGTLGGALSFTTVHPLGGKSA